MLTKIDFTPEANAHVRRITLQVLRHAESCPENVRVVADQLAESDWDWTRLSRVEAELLYGGVTAETVETAVNEFVADTSTVVDLHRHRDDGPQFIHEDGGTLCPLCGHRHIRWGFTLTNTAGGTDLFTGSDCIVQYGLRVDGEATAEAALKKLMAAIGRLKTDASREDWQKENPGHAADMAELTACSKLIDKRYGYGIPYGLRRRLGYDWGEWNNREHKAIATAIRAVLKYYRKHGFLTAKRTEQVYADGLLRSARGIVARFKTVEAEYQTETGDTSKGSVTDTFDWDEFTDQHPGLTAYERDWIARYKRDGRTPATLLPAGSRMIAEIKARHAPPPPPSRGRSRGGIVAPVVDTFADIPFA